MEDIRKSLNLSAFKGPFNSSCIVCVWVVFWFCVVVVCLLGGKCGEGVVCSRHIDLHLFLFLLHRP